MSISLAFGFYWKITEGHRRLFLVGALALLAVDLLELVPPRALGLLIDAVTKGLSAWSPLVIAGAYIGVFVLQGAIRYPLRMGFIQAAAQCVGGLRERTAGHLLRVGGGALSGFSTGDLLRRVTSDLGAVEGALSTGLLFAFDCVFYLVTIPLAMLLLCPRLCAFAFLALPLVPILAHGMVRRIVAASEEAQDSFGCLASRALENAAFAQTVRAYGLENREIQRFQEAADDYVRKDLRRAKSEAFFAGSVQMLIAISVVTVLWLGGREAIASNLSAGQFVAFLHYMGMMAWPLSGLAWSWVMFQKGEVGLRRIQAILDLPTIDQETGEPWTFLKGAMEIRNLTHVPFGAVEPELSDISLFVGAGERVAVIGPTGSGKSTLFQLLTRMIEPSKAMILFDGRDVTTLKLRDFRRSIAVAPQEPFLFTGTIRENIEVGADGTDQVADSAAAAMVTGDEFYKGLETAVGERGEGLSGGQRQRVSLARAFARRQSILVLDDASSALDEESEEKVFQGIPKHAAVLFATNRPVRAANADWVVMLDRGRVVEQGTPEDLLEAQGPYASWVKKKGCSDALETS